MNIRVRDVNDNPPHFVSPPISSKEHVAIQCDRLIEKPLYTFHAEDVDSVPALIRYTLVNATSFPISRDGRALASTSSDSSELFRVYPASGALRLVRQVQCLGSDQKVLLTVRASDGELDATTNFTVIVRRPTSSFFEEADWILKSHVVLVVFICIFCIVSVAYVMFYFYRRVRVEAY